MSLSALTAISPIDGRYHSKANELSAFYSEAALIKYRLRVEVEYFISLCELPLPQLEDFDSDLYDSLRDIYLKFDNKDAQKIKDIESITNHDVKAVEYFIKERFDKLKISEYKVSISINISRFDCSKSTHLTIIIPEIMFGTHG